jgi:hypothetical protein
MIAIATAAAQSGRCFAVAVRAFIGTFSVRERTCACQIRGAGAGRSGACPRRCSVDPAYLDRAQIALRPVPSKVSQESPIVVGPTNVSESETGIVETVAVATIA